MDQKGLIHALEQDEVFSNEVKAILKELDTTSSTSTQAYLNELLLIVRTRLLKNERMVDETTKAPLTLTTYENWIRDEFTNYSSNMYFNSIKD